MKKVFLIKYGEIALKGLNKPYFERMLMQRIKTALRDFDVLSLYRSEGVLYLEADQRHSDEAVIAQIKKVFGIASVSIAYETETDIQKISDTAVQFMEELMRHKGIKTFKVSAKRGFKQFHMKSPEICRQVGGDILRQINGLQVDVHEPDCFIHVDVRRNNSYIYSEKISGYGGLPLGTNGKGLLLLSGGIDSPVAGWMMAKRGMEVEAVHFHSYPYTSERAKEKVLDLAKIVSQYSGKFKISIVNLLNIQQQIAEKCPEDEMTILSRRFMMKISERIAVQNHCHALITGESIGQVASQTIQGLVATDEAVHIPVMRPLIALDKVDIIDISKDIGTYDTSILPFEDCCTVFLPKHPVTKPKLERILESESLLNVDGLVEDALEDIEIEMVDFL
ncbi:MAG: tRNA 4-thiouridine(8) synthase ThiI [Clostridia bacterium]|nr:tRNA 4-thiouridine(8) synthase ThiI [Clostridia bacterium]